jgi:PEP-CTERM motif
MQTSYFYLDGENLMKMLLRGLFSLFLCVAFIRPANALVWVIADGGNGQDYLNKYVDPEKKDLWIGGLQNPGEATANLGWSWVTGEKWDCESWIASEANDYYDSRWCVSNSEQFLSVKSAFGWGWNDEGDLGNISGYITETARVPEPGTIILMGFGLLGIATISRKKFLQS